MSLHDVKLSQPLARAVGLANRTVSTLAAATTTKGPAKKKVVVASFVWTVLGSVVAALVVLQIVRRATIAVLAWHRTRKIRCLSLEDRRTLSATGRKAGLASRLYNVPAAIFGNVFFLRILPANYVSFTTVWEAALTAVYAGGMIGCVMYAASTKAGPNNWANAYGNAAYAQIPFVIGLASKNNTISFLTGISNSQLNCFHRAAGRVMYLCVWMHFIGWATKPAGQGFVGDKAISNPDIACGIVGLVFLTIIIFSSFRIVRKIFYEIFVVIHMVCVAAFLISIYFHHSTVPYVWAGMVIWSFDRVVSLGKFLLASRIIQRCLPASWKGAANVETAAVFEALEGEVVRVTVPCGLGWRAGQYGVPSISASPLEAHPFSFATTTGIKGESKNAVFLIRAERGFTRRLYGRALEKDLSVPVYLNGPYGSHRPMTHYSSVILLSGGTGITHTLAHFVTLLEQPSAVHRLSLVWHIHHVSHLQWIAPVLNAAQQALITSHERGMHVSIDVHVTRSHGADDPGDLEQVLGETVLHQVVSRLSHLGHPNGSSSHGGTSTKTPSVEGEAREKDSLPDSPMSSEELSFEKRSSGNSKASQGNANLEKCGISPVVAEFITVHHGRVNLKSLIGDEASIAAGPVGIQVCGPASMIVDTASAAREANSPPAALRGRQRVDLYRESFGW